MARNEYNEVQTFATSSLDPAVNDVSDVQGTASYKGGAAGVYVRNVYVPSTTGEKELDKANSGHFTAAVHLTASFGGTFRRRRRSGLHQRNHRRLHAVRRRGCERLGRECGCRNNRQRWHCLWHGPRAAAMMMGRSPRTSTVPIPMKLLTVTDNSEQDVGPKVLVGEFNAEFTNGSVAGGFGARKQ